MNVIALISQAAVAASLFLAGPSMAAAGQDATMLAGVQEVVPGFVLNPLPNLPATPIGEPSSPLSPTLPDDDTSESVEEEPDAEVQTPEENLEVGKDLCSEWSKPGHGTAASDYPDPEYDATMDEFCGSVADEDSLNQPVPDDEVPYVEPTEVPIVEATVAP